MSDNTITQSLPSINSGYTTQTIAPKAAVPSSIPQAPVEKSYITTTDNNTSNIYKSASLDPVTTPLKTPTKPTSQTPNPELQALKTEFASLQSDLSDIQGIDDVLNKDPKDITQEDVAKIQTLIKSSNELLYSHEGAKIPAESNKKIVAMLGKLNDLCISATDNLGQQANCDAAIKKAVTKNDTACSELQSAIDKLPDTNQTKALLNSLVTMYKNSPDLASRIDAAKCMQSVLQQVTSETPDFNQATKSITYFIKKTSETHIERSSELQRNATGNTPVTNQSAISTDISHKSNKVNHGKVRSEGHSTQIAAANQALNEVNRLAQLPPKVVTDAIKPVLGVVRKIANEIKSNNLSIQANTTKKEALQNDMKNIMSDIKKTMDNPTMKSLKNSVVKKSIGKLALFKKLIDEKTKELSLEVNKPSYTDNIINESINKIQKNIDKLQDELDLSIDGASADIVPLLQAFRATLTHFGDQKQDIERRTQDSITVDQNNSKVNEENERRQKKYSEAKDAIGILSQNAKINNNVSYRAKVALLENDIKSLGILIQETR